MCVQEWTDERLMWEPKDYSNLKDVVVRADRIWIPELAIINGSVTPAYLQFQGLTPEELWEIASFWIFIIWKDINLVKYEIVSIDFAFRGGWDCCSVGLDHLVWSCILW